MHNESIEDILRNRLSEMKPTAFFCWLKKQKEILNEISKFTEKLNDRKFSLRTKLYWYLNNLVDFPRCTVCGKLIEKDIVNMKIGYHRTCCKKCCYKDESRNKKISEVQLNKSIDEKLQIESRKQQTCLKRYGCKYTFQSDNNKEKTKLTNLKKYGCENCMQSDVIKKKMKENNLKKYGCENVFQVKEVKTKSRQTLKKHYGSERCLYSNSIIAEKRIKHMTETLRRKSYRNCILQNAFDKPCFTEDYFAENYSKDSEFEFECKKCGNKFHSKHIAGCHMLCPKCYPRTSSFPERQISDYLKSICKENIILNSKNIIPPYELDIYIPEKKLAVEFDGLYWHAFENFLKSKGDKNYHLAKTEMCEKLGIQLIHVFEDEWKHKQKTVKNLLKNILNMDTENNQLNGNYEIKLATSDESEKFIDENCLYSNINSKIHLGLYKEKELVALMLFGKSRFKRQHEWELLRFCIKQNYVIYDAAFEKLLNFFEQNFKPKSLVSYVDRRWNTAKLHQKLGFNLLKKTKPNYFYVDNKHQQRFKNFQFKKQILKNKLKNYNDSLTEYQNMRNNGYETIYDCGNLVMVKTYV